MALVLALPSPAPAVSVASGLQSNAVSTPEERRIGDIFLRKLRAGTPVLDDPLVQSWLEDLSYRLAFHAGMNRPDLQIVIIPDRSINAFAVPGGIIGVNAGLFLHADNEAEFAAVLAHELAHVQQRHYARSVDQSGTDQWLYLGALLASIALAAAGGGEAGMALGASAQAAMIQQQLAYSRQHEREADRVGMQTLLDAGYSPRAMPDFFGRLDRESRLVGFLPDFLLTHPLTQERIADSQNRARSLPDRGTLDSEAYRLIRVRLMTLLNATDAGSLEEFRRILKEHPYQEASRLGLALTLKNLKQFDQARAEMAVLLQANPSRLDYLAARADIELADNRPDAALEWLQKGMALSPDSVSLQLYAAHAANLSLKPEQALTWLESLSRQRPRDPLVWELMGEASLQRKDSIGVLRSRAEFRFLSGQGDKAIKDLEQAVRLAKGNYPLQARLMDRLEKIRAQTAEEKEMK